MSIVANLYFGVIRPLQESKGENGAWTENGGVTIFRKYPMGSTSVSISRGLLVGPEQKFNVSVSVKLWEPYIGSATYNFSFKIYNRTLDGEYTETHMVEKTAVIHKDKDTLYIYASSGDLTVTVPSTRGIYIYKVCLEPQRNLWPTIEFPILAESGLVITPISPIV